MNPSTLYRELLLATRAFEKSRVYTETRPILKSVELELAHEAVANHMKTTLGTNPHLKTPMAQRVVEFLPDLHDPGMIPIHYQMTFEIFQRCMLETCKRSQTETVSYAGR